MSDDLPRTLKFATIWLLLGAVVFVGYEWRRHESMKASFSVAGGVVEIKRADDGHYHWPGTLNGTSVDFLVDTGASGVAIPGELAKGFGFFQSKPATAFSPVAVTPDELGTAWHGGRLHLDLESTWNGQRAGLCNAGEEMTFHFGQLIAHLCKTRNARAGSIIGSGTVSNKDWSRGYSCIAEKRAIETIEGGAPKTPFMRFGDTIRIEMKDADGVSIFGAIEQKVARR